MKKAKLLVITTINTGSSEGGRSVAQTMIEFDTIHLANVARNAIMAAPLHNKYIETSVIPLYKSA